MTEQTEAYIEAINDAIEHLKQAKLSLSDAFFDIYESRIHDVINDLKYDIARLERE